MGLLVTSLLLVVFLVGTCTPQDSQVILELSLTNLIDGHIKILQKLDEQEKKIDTQQTMIRDQMENYAATRAQVENCATRTQVDALKTTFITEQEKIETQQRMIRDQMENYAATRAQVENCATRAQVENCATRAQVENSATRIQVDAFKTTFIAEQEDLKNSLQMCSTKEQIITFQDQLEADECEDGSHNCSVSATCTDTILSFKCSCLQGFSGDGYTCQASVCQSPSQVIPGLGCVTPVKEEMTWDNAKENCNTKGLRLLEGIRKEHLQPLKQHFQEYIETAGTSAYCWMGLRGGVWLKSKDPPVAEDDLWYDGYPKGSEQKKTDCGIIDLNHHAPFLYDNDKCSRPYFSLCQLIS